MFKLFRFSCLGILLASPTIPGAAQTAAQPQLGYQVPVQLPQRAAPVWSRKTAAELLAYVERIGSEGLDPAAYAPDRLRAAMDGGDRAVLDETAGGIFLRLTSDLNGGYVRSDKRPGWHMEGNPFNGHDQQRLLTEATSRGVAPVLNGLLPTHPQYVGLRRALASTPAGDEARRDLIRANMERWRWMPRNLGARHVLVNVPAFTAAIVDGGEVTARHRTIVGKPGTPTPQLSASVRAITFNPWWNVPQSIIPELGKMKGYEVKRAQDGTLIVRQPPGPANSLGRVKLEMPNDHAIYLHDTPAQGLFAKESRAFSHGCIRTQSVRDFAAVLLAPTGQWDRAAIDRAVAAGKTVQADLAEPVPVYIAYFTAAATADGDIVTYRDIYGRDAPVRQALNRTSASAETLAP